MTNEKCVTCAQRTINCLIAKEVPSEQHIALFGHVSERLSDTDLCDRVDNPHGDDGRFEPIVPGCGRNTVIPYIVDCIVDAAILSDEI